MIDQPARRAGPLLISVLAAALVLGLALAVPVLVGDGEAGLAGSADPLAGVETFDLGPPRHVDGDVAYAQAPPVGGNHYPVWFECGRYDQPLRNEIAVHNLEHGTVWIAHRPDLPAGDVATLESALPADGILSPYPGLPAPVVVTVWGAQLRLDGADDPGLAAFLQEYGDGATAPESEASCAGGVGNPVQPALNA